MGMSTSFKLRLIFSVLQFLSVLTNVYAVEVNSIYDVEEALKSVDVISVDNLIERLSKEITGKPPVVVYDSKSSRPSSVKRPSVLMVNGEADFFLGFSTDETKASYNKIEFAQVDLKTGEPDFYLLDFNKSNKLIKNPSQCMACHQKSNGRRYLKIESYPVWPGWFGVGIHQGYKDRLGKAETQKTEELLESLYQVPRLKRFKGMSQYDFENFAHAGAFRFNRFISYTQGKALFHALYSHPEFEKFKYGLAAYLEGSSIEYGLKRLLPEDLYQEFMKDNPALSDEIIEHEAKRSDMIADQIDKSLGIRIDYSLPIKANYEGILYYSFIEWLLRRNGDSLSNYSASAYGTSFYDHDGLTGYISTLKSDLFEHLKAQSGLPVVIEYTDMYDLDETASGVIYRLGLGDERDFIEILKEMRKAERSSETCVRELLN